MNSCVQDTCVHIPDISWEDIKLSYGIPKDTEFKGPMPSSGNLAHILGNVVFDWSELQDAQEPESSGSSDVGSSGFDISGFGSSGFEDGYENSSIGYSSKFENEVLAQVIRSNSRSRRSNNSQCKIRT